MLWQPIVVADMILLLKVQTSLLWVEKYVPPVDIVLGTGPIDAAESYDGF